jgi:hypothetical protein
MKKLNYLALALAAMLTACGGGSDDPATPDRSGGNNGVAGTSAAPVNATFTSHNYLQNLDSSGTSATYSDIGVGAAGTLTYGATGTLVSMTPQADGGIIYGAPITYGMAVGDNGQAANLPAMAMLCQAAANGDGTNGRKSTDVLVKAQAIRISTAAALANQSFKVLREDCAVSSGTTLRFDASGNATVTDGSGTATISAAEMTNALSGNAPLAIAGEDGYLVFYAYSYTKDDGSTAYALVEHGSPSTTSLTRGYVMLWAQE